MLFHNVTLYTHSLLLRIHVTTTYLLNIMCIWVASCTKLGRLDCIFCGSLKRSYDIRLLFLHSDSVYSRKGGVDLYFHTFVLWASDWGWIEQTLNSRRSPPETAIFLPTFKMTLFTIGWSDSHEALLIRVLVIENTSTHHNTIH
jgi:hypothetical protein